MNKSGFWSCVFLATGTMIGVGLLAVPIITGLLGFIPGLVLTLLATLMMWLAGALIAERAMALKIADGDITSLYVADLGPWVKWITIPVYLLLFYAILVAYLSAAAGIVTSISPLSIPTPAWVLAVFIFCSILMLFGQTMMLRFNGIIVTLMLACFIAMLLTALSHITPQNLTHTNLPLAPFTLPVLACAFTYHSVIPFICRRLDHDRQSIHLALTLAVIIALGMTAVWLLVVSGALPYQAASDAPSLLRAYQNGSAATIPLAEVTGSRAIAIFADGFSLLALLTSYLGIGAALSSFIRDIAPALRPPNRAPHLFATVFLPPLTLALIEPDIFLAMVGVAGGFGVIVLFGMLPVLASYRSNPSFACGRKAVLLIMLAFFLLVFGIELAKVIQWYAPTF